MKLIAGARIACFLLLLNSSFSKGYQVFYENEMHRATGPVEDESYISCTCSGRTKRMAVNLNDIKQVFMEIQHHKYCDQKNDSEICELFKGCYNCTVEMTGYKSSQRSNGYRLYTKRRLITHQEPAAKRIVKAPQCALDHPQRNPRQIRSCIFPKSLKTADISCRIYPSSVTCTQKCVYGYTLKEGIGRKMKCLYSENVWKPAAFEECRPFVDCTMQLITPGKIACRTVTINTPLTCNVTCYEYEDQPGSKAATYECKISGTWNKKLPSCVISQSGFELAPDPRIKLHSSD